MTFVRKAQFRSAAHMQSYFRHCDKVVEQWRAMGPQFLETENDTSVKGCIFASSNINNNYCNGSAVIGEEAVHPHGVYLFKHRAAPLDYFPPNFHPPYNTAEKRKIIANVLSRNWNTSTLQWTAETPITPAAHAAQGTQTEALVTAQDAFTTHDEE